MAIVRRRALICLFLAVLVAITMLDACGKAQRDASRRAAAELQAALAGRAPAFVTAHHEGARLWKAIRTFYSGRRYQPAWIDGTRPTRQLDAVIRALDNAGQHGLDPELYDLGPLSVARSQARSRLLGPSGFTPETIAPLDLRLTAAWLEYASDLSDGVTARPHVDPMWKVKPRPVDLVPILASALDSNRVEETLAELAPSNEEYRRLQKARDQYVAIANAGGWPALPASLALRPGQRSRHIAILASRLAVTGDLRSRTTSHGSVYDAELQEAVRRFEARHGLPDSRTLTRAVVAAMNVPVGTRIRQIELNMERWRWFPRDLGDVHIRVNVPEYHLEVREHGRVALAMNVVVGAVDKPTPIFSDSMTTIAFAPYWNVPASIATDETLPAVLGDPEYLSRNNIDVVATNGDVIDPQSIDWSRAQDEASFPYRFRQRPGTANSLGRVKFLFPNDFDVYLHDTPAAALFSASYRALSHGCVRVQDPVTLAAYLLKGSRRWDGPRIEQAMNAGEERQVKLPAAIPVHLMYWTARVDDGGTVRFFDDIYGHDTRQWADYQARITRVKQRKAVIPNEATAWLPGVKPASANASGGKPAGPAPGGGRRAPRAPAAGTALR
ncbi:MAG TPA: L,D-transpeptidase family protein [Gemmatimonadaceae bacterium]